jgi:hypothetical protein
MKRRVLAATMTMVSIGAGCRTKGPEPMGFFVTSVGKGDGGNLGGLEGADAHCQRLASAVGAGDLEWRAYLSATPRDGRPAVNARDRIGPGPWSNAKHIRIASGLRDLHEGNAIGPDTSLNERGQVVDANMHDILTGSTGDGKVVDQPDGTCRAWTSNSEGRAVVGHHDRGRAEPAVAWNSAHRSSSCSARGLESTGGAGLFYCFAKR